MPASYQIPPWIAMQAPPNPAEAYISNLRVGAQIGQEQAQLAQRRELAQMQLLAKQQEAAQEQRLAQQKIEYDHAMRQAELGLEQQKLEEAKQVNQVKIQAAARQFAAQQAIEADIAGGMSPEAAMLRHAAGMDFSAGDIGALVKAARPTPLFEPRTMEVPGAGTMVQESPQRWSRVPPPPQTGPVTPEQVIDPNTRQVDPNAYATRGPTGTPSIHYKRQPPKPPVDEKAKVERQLLREKIRRLTRVLDEASGVALAQITTERWEKELAKPKKDRVAKNNKEMRAIVRKEIEDEIAKLEEQVRATVPESPQGGSGIRFDSKTGKLIREQSAVSEAAPDLASEGSEDPDDEENG